MKIVTEKRTVSTDDDRFLSSSSMMRKKCVVVANRIGKNEEIRKTRHIHNGRSSSPMVHFLMSSVRGDAMDIFPGTLVVLDTRTSFLRVG